jgi:homospermidine synthase
MQVISSKVIFLGYGAVAKCVWAYFNQFFSIDPSLVYLVDKDPNTFRGALNGAHTLVRHIDAQSIHTLCKDLDVAEGDIIIDLTFCSATYAFIEASLHYGLVYINTSIEDQSDVFLGRSIAYQQQHVKNMCNEFAKKNGIKRSILTECGQNPGMIQHYVFYALQELNAMRDPYTRGDYSRNGLCKAITDNHIGTILMSEIDGLTTTRTLEPNRLYNTWSVAGFVCEALDATELVRGTTNPYCQPTIPDALRHPVFTKLFKPYQSDTDVVFLNEIGLNMYMPSICPTIHDGYIHFTNFEGKLIHHGEIFELANFFGANAPFMSYVYQNSPYMDQSLASMKKLYGDDDSDLKMLLLQDPTSFCVFDNINQSPLMGFDSIGCTLFCGKEQVESIYWCGSICHDKDANVLTDFTPTITQVAAGVLSGLSYILEPTTKAAYYQSVDIPTPYMMDKAKPLLGKFFFTEIPVDLYTGDLTMYQYNM